LTKEKEKLFAIFVIALNLRSTGSAG